MTLSSKSNKNACEPVRTLSIDNWHVELLPCAPYQAAYRTKHSSVGYAFSNQTGIHAIGTDKRTDFRAAPNSIAYLPQGCDVYSESEHGGEYLKIWRTNNAEPRLQSIDNVRNVVDPIAVIAAHNLRRILVAGKLIDPLAFEQYLTTLYSCAIQLEGDESRRNQVDENQPDGKWSIRVLDFIEEKLNTQLTVASLAKTFNQSSRQFSRNFIRMVGTTPHSYIIDRRLVRARNLLMKTHWDISTIAQECGFSSHSHLTSQLRRRHGATPSQLKIPTPR